MKSLVTIVLVGVLLSLGGCGGGSGSSKDLFSLWNEVDTNAALDLRGGEFGTPMDFSFFFEGGEQCDCRLTLLGNQSSGTYVVNFCSYRFGSGIANPGCNALNDTGFYEKSDKRLTVTGSAGFTDTYR